MLRGTFKIVLLDSSGAKLYAENLVWNDNNCGAMLTIVSNKRGMVQQFHHKAPSGDVLGSSDRGASCLKRRPHRVVFVETNDGICSEFFIWSNVNPSISSLYASETVACSANRYSKSAHESYSSISELEHNVRERSPEQIFEEIVRECEEIERRSLSSSSPPSISSASPMVLIVTFIAKDISFDQPALVPQREHSEKKKAQNRAAATRYRERKRREREVARLQVLQLETYNAKLRARATEIEKEISYLRNLMEEVHSRSR
ncbi:unnamed protein product [Toxocara canis]|uniref:BZIP domain-containing protein n=1 Tax=Toxocara canis TaxID=6265 RepID=A0A183V0H3_TOXCA|nr:unnamed protein product [Toxocara canis]